MTIKKKAPLKRQGKPPLGEPGDSGKNEPRATPGSETRTPAAARKPPVFPVVGIGASAGGLAAFEAFFAGMPADVDTGMAFVLVQHLAPDHKSILSRSDPPLYPHAGLRG